MSVISAANKKPLVSALPLVPSFAQPRYSYSDGPVGEGIAEVETEDTVLETVVVVSVAVVDAVPEDTVLPDAEEDTDVDDTVMEDDDEMVSLGLTKRRS